MDQNVSDSSFRSTGLWVMSPTRFLCAKSLLQNAKILNIYTEIAIKWKLIGSVSVRITFSIKISLATRHLICCLPENRKGFHTCLYRISPQNDHGARIIDASSVAVRALCVQVHFGNIASQRVLVKAAIGWSRDRRYCWHDRTSLFCSGWSLETLLSVIFRRFWTQWLVE